MCQKSREFPIHTIVRYSVLSILFRTYSERPVRFGIPLSFVKVVELRRSLRKKGYNVRHHYISHRSFGQFDKVQLAKATSRGC